MIRIKRVYEAPSKNDGLRLLVDRLWPRGLSKDRAKVDKWLKEIAPSNELRKWYNHDPERWEEFKRRYFEELEGQGEDVDWILDKSKGHTATLLYSSKEDQLNNAVALKEYLEDRSKKSLENAVPKVS